MATPQRTALRAEIPSLQPDGALLEQLTALARGSALNGPPARPATRTGWRVALAAVAAASVIGGGAFVAAALTGEGAHTPTPQGPVTHPGVPEPSRHQARHPERASGGSGDASGTETAQDPQGQSDDQSGSQPQGAATAPAGPGPVSHPTSDPTDDPGDPGEDDPTTGSTDGSDEGTDTPSDDPSDEASTPWDGGDAESEQAAPSDDADPRGE